MPTIQHRRGYHAQDGATELSSGTTTASSSDVMLAKITPTSIPSSPDSSNSTNSGGDLKDHPKHSRRPFRRQVFRAYSTHIPVALVAAGCLGGLVTLFVGLTTFVKYIREYGFPGRALLGGPRGFQIAGKTVYSGGAKRKSIKLNPEEFENGDFDQELILPWNSLYRVPDAMPIVGDRSDRYAKLREQVDPLLEQDPDRSAERVRELQTHTDFFNPLSMDAHNSDQVAYDIYNCPDSPPVGYPFSWNIAQILENWPPDDPTPRPNIYQGLCVFDFTKDVEKAMRYRSAELPFVVVNDPDVHRAVERWNVPGYMESMLGDGPHRCEYSANNHFMYYVPVSKNRRKTGVVPSDWKPPTQMTRMTYKEWYEHANVTDDQLGPEKPHWYFRLIGCGLMGNTGSCDRGSSEYLYDELPFFQPKKSLYIVEPMEQKGIHCRFGMKGVIAENHFDGSRNSIAVLGGSRRYILSHPDQCDKLALYPKGHPSARHSAVDWSEPDYNEFPQFAQAQGNEVVLQAGQVLYLPTNWFHYIISLELNFQCNTRSGIGQEYMPPIHACGF